MPWSAYSGPRPLEAARAARFTGLWPDSNGLAEGLHPPGRGSDDDNRHPRGSVLNVNLAEYAVPGHADAPPVMDVIFVEEHVPHVNPLL